MLRLIVNFSGSQNTPGNDDSELNPIYASLDLEEATKRNELNRSAFFFGLKLAL